MLTEAFIASQRDLRAAVEIRIRQGVSAEGDLAYTYGHASAKDGSYQGHYVRVWRKVGPQPTDWFLIVDLFAAK